MSMCLRVAGVVVREHTSFTPNQARNVIPVGIESLGGTSSSSSSVISTTCRYIFSDKGRSLAKYAVSAN